MAISGVWLCLVLNLLETSTQTPFFFSICQYWIHWFIWHCNVLQLLSVLNQKTQLQLKTTGIKTIIHTIAKKFIIISNWTKNYNVVFLLFNSFGYINWRNTGILWKVMMCLLCHSLWHESWPTMFWMKVDRYKHCVGHFS